MTELPDMEVTAADLKRQADTQGPITIEIDPFSAFCVIGQIQLASRHPENMGASADMACRFAADLKYRHPDV
ncbi:MAG: hypothetical protein F4Y04_06685 [Chloroflexi bacterium]|nr:hypothetical protein [Chloroflexota bacterium]